MNFYILYDDILNNIMCITFLLRFEYKYIESINLKRFLLFLYLKFKYLQKNINFTKYALADILLVLLHKIT